MRSKTKTIVIGLSLFLQSYVVGYAGAEPIQIVSQGGGAENSAAVSPPPKERLALVFYLPLIVAGKTLGSIAAYDDGVSGRPVDYAEFYDNAGTLVAIGWFDRFGIERLAVDQALLEDTGAYQGVFVLILTGTAV